MPDEITELTELMETYRRRSREMPYRPIAAAYSDAADDIQEMIAGLRAASAAHRLPARLA
jgi:hypothetical protein